MFRYCQSLAIVSIVFVLCGCSTFESFKEYSRKSFQAMKFRPDDYPDPTDAGSEPWANEVGEIARGHRAKEQDPDPWYGKLLSKKARSIENSLGVKY